MRQIPIFQIDAFADDVFAGNPAAVCPLTEWPEDALLQAIAAENNLSETAFFAPEGPESERGRYRLRWFTPAAEVDLCGHATLASAFVLFNELEHRGDTLRFETRSGTLTVKRGEDGFFEMDFPAKPATALTGVDFDAVADRLEQALGRRPTELHRAVYLMAVYETAAEVTSLQLTSRLETALKAAGYWGLIATAPGEEGEGPDFVSRFFAPEKGVPEDPVTGSAHCTLAPFWAERLGRDALTGHQASARGGTVRCRVMGDRVGLSGRCAPFLKGHLLI